MRLSPRGITKQLLTSVAWSTVTVSSVSASALNLVNLNQENLPDDSNVLFADLIPSLSTSG